MPVTLSRRAGAAGRRGFSAGGTWQSRPRRGGAPADQAGAPLSTPQLVMSLPAKRAQAASQNTTA